MASYFPLHAHTHFSTLDGLTKPAQTAERVRKLGLAGCAITDHGTISGVPSFVKALGAACKHCGRQENTHYKGGECPGYEKGPLKPILGLEFYISQQDSTRHENDNRSLSHLVVLAKDTEGWKNLVRACSASNRPENFYYKPRLDLEKLASFSGGHFVCFSGHMGSDLANVVFGEPKLAYRARTYEEAKSMAKPWPDLKSDLIALAGKYVELFGKENFSLEDQRIDQDNLPACIIVSKAVHWVAKHLGLKVTATADSHYAWPEDAVDQRVLVASALKATMPDIQRRLDQNEDVMLGGFFKSNRYHIPSSEEMEAIHGPEELKNSLAIAEMCGPYDLFAPPKIPQFPTPDGVSDNQHLRQLCRDGWRKKVEGKIAKVDQGVYVDRVNRELAVLEKAGLAPYFLIVEDFCRYAHEVLKAKPSHGRGSGAGSLVLHLLDVIDCDPIRYDLLFERFYNDGRNAPGRIALPDVDCDFPVGKRDAVIDYLKNKWGKDKVAQMGTFTRMKGRTAISDVLGVHAWGTFEARKLISKALPPEPAIADLLQEMREEEGEATTIKWVLENDPDALKEYCTIDPDGKLVGPLATLFAQAIRLEGTIKAAGKHPSGVVISPVPLEGLLPMVRHGSSEDPICGFEMNDVEAVGGVKFDILAVSMLDRVEGASYTARTGKVLMP